MRFSTASPHCRHCPRPAACCQASGKQSFVLPANCSGGVPDPTFIADENELKASGLSTEFVEQSLRLLEVRYVEAFGEPTVDRCEQVAGFGAAALVATQPGEARGGAQFPQLCLLAPADFQSFMEQRLGVRRVSIPEQLAAATHKLGLEPVLALRP